MKFDEAKGWDAYPENSDYLRDQKELLDHIDKMKSEGDVRYSFIHRLICIGFEYDRRRSAREWAELPESERLQIEANLAQIERGEKFKEKWWNEHD